MKRIQRNSSLYQAGLGILTEIAYSFAIIAVSFGIIYIVLILLPWFSNPH